jgi:CDGSH-type Zn-finger protein/uncharacterized Fe-S cluster protein YjdI
MFYINTDQNIFTGNEQMKERIIKYKGKAIDVYFTVDRCTHVSECVRGAPKVFDPSRTPWIDVDAADPDKVAEVVLRCPTGALHFKRKDNGFEEAIPDRNQIDVCKNGPLYVKGDIEIRNDDNTLTLEDTRIALCRCGSSKIKPLCDGSHIFSFMDQSEFVKRKTEGKQGHGKLIVTLNQNGPYALSGPIEVRELNGSVLFRGNRVMLCRCGASKEMPFCDGSHRKINFKTSEKIVLYKKTKDPF